VHACHHELQVFDVVEELAVVLIDPQAVAALFGQDLWNSQLVYHRLNGYIGAL
jgi:hypothetical protein